jgi:hypothetical protein
MQTPSWKYKTLMLTTLAAIGLALIGNIPYLRTEYMIYKPVDILRTITHMAYLYTIVIVLKKHSESFYRALPYYALMAMGVLEYFGRFYIVSQPTSILLNYFMGLNIVFAALNLYTLINVFWIRDSYLAKYFKIKAVLMVLLTGMSFVLPRMLATVHYMAYIHYISIPYLLPLIVMLVLYYNLYNQYEVFRTGDSIIAKKELDNIPQGTNGTVVMKHSNSNYYEVEFMDDKGNLLNALSVSANDIEHVILPDLQTRVDSFGRE